MLKKLAAGMALVLALLSGDVFAQDLVGRWYGEGYQRREYIHWNVDRRADGSFSVEFRKYNECELVERWEEAGIWKVTGTDYFTVTVTVAGGPSRYFDEYVLDRVTSGSMSYTHKKTGTRFRATRTSGESYWPECEKDKLTS